MTTICQVFSHKKGDMDPKKQEPLSNGTIAIRIVKKVHSKQVRKINIHTKKVDLMICRRNTVEKQANSIVLDTQYKE